MTKRKLPHVNMVTFHFGSCLIEGLLLHRMLSDSHAAHSGGCKLTALFLDVSDTDPCYFLSPFYRTAQKISMPCELDRSILLEDFSPRTGADGAETPKIFFKKSSIDRSDSYWSDMVSFNGSHRDDVPKKYRGNKGNHQSLHVIHEMWAPWVKLGWYLEYVGMGQNLAYCQF